MAAILSRHLPNYYFRVGIDMNGASLQGECALQRFQQSQIFGHVVVLAANPLGNSDFAAPWIINDYANASRPRVA